MVLFISCILTWLCCRPGKGQITAASCHSSFPTGGTLHDRREETKNTPGFYCGDDDDIGDQNEWKCANKMNPFQTFSTLLQFL